MNILKVNNISTIGKKYFSIIPNKQLFAAYIDIEAQSARKIELRLIQSKNSIENPKIHLLAEFL